MTKLDRASIVPHERLLNDAPVRIVSASRNLQGDRFVGRTRTSGLATGQQAYGARNGQGMHNGLRLRIPDPIASFVVKCLVV